MAGVLEETVLNLKHTQRKTTAFSNRAEENLPCVAFKVHKALVHSLYVLQIVLLGDAIFYKD